MVYHPCRDEHGQLVVIRNPSSPSPLAHWQVSSLKATAVPACAMLDSLNGIALLPAADVPAPSEFIDEPAFAAPPGLRHAAGAVVVEDDGRVWLVSPTNDFGGPEPTFPKGRVDPGASLQATAVREVYEESGLVVRLEAWLADVRRTQTYTRYYLARRIGGCPSAMGWETQAVHLVPLAKLGEVATKKHDEPIIEALRKLLAAG